MSSITRTLGHFLGPAHSSYLFAVIETDMNTRRRTLRAHVAEDADSARACTGKLVPHVVYESERIRAHRGIHLCYIRTRSSLVYCWAETRQKAAGILRAGIDEVAVVRVGDPVACRDLVVRHACEVTL